jgi:hypothetical protein
VLSIATLRVVALACLSLPLVHAASQQVIYGINPNGDLFYYQYLGMGDGAFSWGKVNVPAGNGWSFRHVFSGGDGVVFAITDTGDLFYYKYLGVNNGVKAWGKTHVLIGTGWNFAHVFSGGNGMIFAINDAGELFYYKYLGMATGAAGNAAWGKTKVQIGNGWNLPYVFSGGDGVIFAITDTGDLSYYKYLGMNDGSHSWGKVNMKIGHGWNFRHVFSGGDGVIFASNDAGELFYYKYLGMSTGAEAWGATGKQIGTGWILDHVFAEFPTPQDPAPRVEQLPPPEDPKCAAYASAAVAAARTAQNNAKCRVSPENGRWSAVYQDHYKWCLAAPPASRASESAIRDKHLLDCGATKIF